jgi:hypothetical protein
MYVNPTGGAHSSGEYHLLDDIHPDFHAGLFCKGILIKS